MKALAVITARGGSKRIPKKNIKLFCGKPIIAYSIEAALRSNIFDEVMVSTDSKEIAEIAISYGAKVPFMRSERASNDQATTMEVLREVIWEYEKTGEKYDVLACLYPTAPFITAEKLKKAYEMLISNDADSVCPVVRFSFPPQRASVIVDGYLKYKWPENYPARSQDLEPFYHDCGQFYFYRTKSMMEKDKTELKELPVIIDEMEVQDIDNETDWKLAEMKYKMWENDNVL